MPVFQGIQDACKMRVGDTVIYLDDFWPPDTVAGSNGHYLVCLEVAKIKPGRHRGIWHLVEPLARVTYYIGRYDVNHMSFQGQEHEYAQVMVVGHAREVLKVHLTPEEIWDRASFMPFFRQCQPYFDDLGMTWWLENY